MGEETKVHLNTNTLVAQVCVLPQAKKRTLSNRATPRALVPMTAGMSSGAGARQVNVHCAIPPQSKSTPESVLPAQRDRWTMTELCLRLPQSCSV